jgi:hypothetical protein
VKSWRLGAKLAPTKKAGAYTQVGAYTHVGAYAQVGAYASLKKLPGHLRSKEGKEGTKKYNKAEVLSILHLGKCTPLLFRLHKVKLNWCDLFWKTK